MAVFLIVYTISALILFIGLIVYIHKRNSLSNQIFLALSVVTIVWAIFRYLSVINTDLDKVLFWLRLDLFASVPHVMLFWAFVNVFPKARYKINPLFLWGYFLVLIFFSSLSLSPYVYKKVILDNRTFIPVPGKLIFIWGMFMVLGILSSIFIAWKRYNYARSYIKTQWRVLLIGLSLSYLLLIITNFLMVAIFRNTIFIPYGPLFMLPAIIGIAYAIVRYNILNVKLISTEIFVFLLISIELLEILLSTNHTEFIFRSIIIIIVLFLSWLLIKSVLQEIKQKEKIVQYAKSLKKTNNNLQELLKMKNEFISIVSHQLRTPLTSLRGLLDMQVHSDLNKISKEDKHRIHLNMLHSANKLNSLVNDLLNSVKLEGGIKLDIKKINLYNLIKEVIQDFKPDYDKKGLYIKMTGRQNVEIEGDRHYLKEVFINLIDNAQKYTNEGGVQVDISKNQKWAIVKVQDTGIGISPKERQNIFKKLYRGKRASLYYQDGSGLGLYIVKRIVEENKGKIAVKSKGENKGSTFIIKLPIKYN